MKYPSCLGIPFKDRLGAIKEVPQWIKKYHELIVADGFSHLWSSFIKICMLQVLIRNKGILLTKCWQRQSRLEKLQLVSMNLEFHS